jgi:hypothetical protein
MFLFAIFSFGQELFPSQLFLHNSFTIPVTAVQELSRLLFQRSYISALVFIQRNEIISKNGAFETPQSPLWVACHQIQRVLKIN